MKITRDQIFVEERVVWGALQVEAVESFKGTDPFLGGDFLFMDRSYWNLHRICKTEKKITFCSWKFFDFRNSFWKKLDFDVFWLFIIEISKE